MKATYDLKGQAVIDWSGTEKQARAMLDNELLFAIRDCRKAGKASRDLENAGNFVSKTEGFYLDESYVFSAELMKRRKS